MKKRKNKGQGILEYVVVLTAIVAVIILAAVNVMNPAVTTTYDNVGETVNFAADTWLTKTTGAVP